MTSSPDSNVVNFGAGAEAGLSTNCKMLEVVFLPLNQSPSFILDWQMLADKVGIQSFFMSANWQAAWVAHIADEQALVAKVVDTKTKELFGLALLSKSRIKRRKIFSVSQYVLNSSVSPNCDMVIEYNQVLCAPEQFCLVHSVFIRAFYEKIMQAGEEFFIPFSIIDAFQNTNQITGFQLENVQALRSWRVLKNDSSDFFSASYLSANRRHQIRRAIRLYERQFGAELKIHIAENTEQALEYFSALGDLHTLYWQSKGMPGSFANEKWREFHQAIIHSGIDHGKIQLLKVSAGDGCVVGYLYNVVEGDWVGNIQSGFNYRPDDKRLKPGFVCHALAVQLNFDLGRSCYDMLAGDGDQKTSLANSQQPMTSWSIQKPSLQRRIENSLVAMVRHLKSYIKK